MKKSLILALLLCLALSACNVNINTQIIEGSGKLGSETRSLAGFDAIELAGSGDLEVVFGENESVFIETDDNILPLIETRVRGGTLIISTRSNTNILPQLGIHILVTMKSIKAVSLPGSGNISIPGLQAQSFEIDLPGSGNIAVEGSVENLDAAISGSGNILCGDLRANSATARLEGSGLIVVNASDSLTVNINGSGSVHYRGSPANINQTVNGSGSINQIP
jgi:hypothetical protein